MILMRYIEKKNLYNEFIILSILLFEFEIDMNLFIFEICYIFIV